MSRVEPSESPRAIVHTRILDVASERPDASLEEIAGRVSAATPELVERVLDEYGDPAEASPASDSESEPDASPASDSGSEADASPAPDASQDTDADEHPPMSQDFTSDAASENGKDHPAEGEDAPAETDQSTTDPTAPAASLSMTDKQRETLRAVHERPEASQAEIANTLDVTRATVSRRLNDLEDFSWTDRADFAAAHLDSAGVAAGTGAATRDHPQEIEQDGTGSVDDAEPADGTGSVERADPADSVDAAEPVDAPQPSGIDELADRLAGVEDRLRAVERGSGDADLDPELVHKVAHACMESDALTREEELQVLEYLMG